MARNEFETEVGKLLSVKFPFCKKIDDSAFNREGQRQVSRKPFDFFCYTPMGYFVCAEAKRTISNRLPLVNIADHQREALEFATQNNCIALLFINWRKAPGSRCGVAVCIPYLAFKSIEDALDKKSISWVDIPQKFHMQRISGGWDFNFGDII